MARRPFGRERRRSIALGAIALGTLALAACNSNTRLTSRVDPRYGVSASPRVIEPGQPVPKGGGTYRVGKPYMVAGRTYYPEENRRYRREGIASWYGEDFHGRLTANGEIYDMDAISAAHPTMPMPSYARVTNLENGRSIIVRVNDRGPYAPGRIIDLSTGTAKALGTYGQGLARVRVEYVGRAGLAGSDDNALMATLRHGAPAPAPGSIRLATARASVLGSNRDSGATPLPPERPFLLGGDVTVGAPPRAAPPAAAPKRVRSPVSVLPDHVVSEPAAPAAPAERAPALGLMSGRGLY